MKVDVGAMSSRKVRWIGMVEVVCKKRGAVVEVVVGRFLLGKIKALERKVSKSRAVSRGTEQTGGGAEAPPAAPREEKKRAKCAKTMFYS